MKILRKGDNFKKVKDSTFDDLKKLNSLLNDGWNYSPKKDYKELHKGKTTEVKDEIKKDKKEKVEKRVEKKIEKKKVDKKSDKKKKK